MVAVHSKTKVMNGRQQGLLRYENRYERPCGTVQKDVAAVPLLVYNARPPAGSSLELK